MEIKLNTCNIETILWKIRLLNRIHQWIEVKTVSGNGKGKIVNSLDDMANTVKEMQRLLHMLLENTETLLEVYSGQMQTTDHYAANVLRKGKTHD